MKSKEEIINDSIKFETPPGDYNLLETHCFLALKQLIIMFYNKRITKENATKIKQLILADYDKRYKEFNFQQSMFQEHIKNIRKTETKRTKFRKILIEERSSITKEKLYEIVNLATEIINITFNDYIKKL